MELFGTYTYSIRLRRDFWRVGVADCGGQRWYMSIVEWKSNWYPSKEENPHTFVPRGFTEHSAKNILRSCQTCLAILPVHR